jgi:hypothetical protein
MPACFAIKLLPETIQRADFEIGAYRPTGPVDGSLARHNKVNVDDFKTTSAIGKTVNKSSARIDSHGRTRASKRKPLPELEQLPAPKKRRSVACKGKAKA